MLGVRGWEVRIEMRMAGVNGGYEWSVRMGGCIDKWEWSSARLGSEQRALPLSQSREHLLGRRLRRRSLSLQR